MASRQKLMQNCRFCGRDTTSESAICSACFGKPAKGRGRKGLSTNSLYVKSSFHLLEEDKDAVSEHRHNYHGDTVRDDL